MHRVYNVPCTIGVVDNYGEKKQATVNVLNLFRTFFSVLRLKIKRNGWLQPIIALYFKSENELKFYNLEAWSHNILVKIANRNTLNRLLKKQSNLGLRCLSMHFWHATNV